MVSCSIPNPVRPAEKKYDYFHWTDEKTEAQKRNLFFSEVIQWVSILGLLILKLLFFSLWHRVFGLFPCLETNDCGMLLPCVSNDLYFQMKHIGACASVSVCVGDAGEKLPILAPAPVPSASDYSSTTSSIPYSGPQRRSPFVLTEETVSLHSIPDILSKFSSHCPPKFLERFIECCDILKGHILFILILRFFCVLNWW